jgi:broad specificity phosphatase PhoE
MSDLQCAATLLIARHGEANSTSSLDGSGGGLTAAGREQSRELGKSLRDRRVSIVYTSPTASAVQTAEIIADELGVGVRVREDLRDVSDEPGESGEEVVERMRGELDTAADLHRGETVLFVGHARAICAAVPQLASNVPDDYPEGRPLDHGGVVEVAVDADGCVMRSWAHELVR